MLGVHAADEAELVGDAGRERQHLRDIRAALEGVDVVGLVDFDAAGKRLPGEMLAPGFEIVVSGRTVQEISEDEVAEAEAGSLE